MRFANAASSILAAVAQECRFRPGAGAAEPERQLVQVRQLSDRSWSCCSRAATL